MDTSQFYQGRFFRAAEIADPMVLTIANVKAEKMNDGTMKPVMSFDEEDQSVVLNKTNLTLLQEALGHDSDNWIGHQIELSASLVNFGSKRVPGLQVKVLEKEPPKQTKLKISKAAQSAPADPDFDDDVPY